MVMVWFRNDLRVHDNEALSAANKDGAAVLPVYCFDPRDFGTPSVPWSSFIPNPLSWWCLWIHVDIVA